MPIKNKFNKDDVITAAFNLVRKNGWDKCSARAIAKELKASTMPIYSCIKSMRELKAQIAMKAADIMVGYQKRRRTEIDFLDVGIGYVLFALEEKHLFRLLFFDLSGDASPDVESKAYEEDTINAAKAYAFEMLLDYLSDSEILAGLTRKEKKKILYKMWIFSHGLAVLINNGRITEVTEKEITDLLLDSGLCVIEGARILNQKTNS